MRADIPEDDQSMMERWSAVLLRAMPIAIDVPHIAHADVPAGTAEIHITTGRLPIMLSMEEAGRENDCTCRVFRWSESVCSPSGRECIYREIRR